MPEIWSDSVYRQEGGVFEGPPPWKIGEPQPEIAELIRARSSAATAATREQGLTNAAFVQAHITSFTGYDGPYSTILDNIASSAHGSPRPSRRDRLCRRVPRLTAAVT
jgi:hypothetical protein